MPLIGTCIVAIVAFVLCYYIACYISPPYVVIDNETYTVMPTGQIGAAIIASIVISIPTFLFYLRKYGKLIYSKI